MTGGNAVRRRYVKFSMGLRRFLPIVVTCAITLQGASADLFKPSQMDQVRLGQQAAAELRKQEKVVPTSDARVRLLRSVAARLLSTFHDNAPWQWTFDVIESKEINAFALPGGSTFFYTGLLDKLKSEDELAAVLGHEMTHVRREHWAKAYADQEKRSIGLSLLLGVVHAPDMAYNVSGVLNSLYDLKFSRGDETQADDGGFLMMIQAGYNPQGMADVFQMLEDVQKGGAPPEFLSDHPSDKNRIARIQGKIQGTQKTFPQQIPIAFDVDTHDAALPDGVKG